MPFWKSSCSTNEVVQAENVLWLLMTTPARSRSSAFVVDALPEETFVPDPEAVPVASTGPDASSPEYS